MSHDTQLEVRKKRGLPVLRSIWPKKEFRKTKIVIAGGAALLASVWLVPLGAAAVGLGVLIAENKLDE